MVNPTQRIQEEIFEVINKSKTPLSITAIATKSRKGFKETKQTIEFFKKFGIIKTIVSSGNVTIVQLNKPTIQNASTN